MIFLCFVCPDGTSRFADFEPKDGRGEYSFEGMKKQCAALNTPLRYGRYYCGDVDKKELPEDFIAPSYEEWRKKRVQELLRSLDKPNVS